MRDAAPMTRRVDLALLPAEATAIEADCYVLVDILRATTTIAVLFDRGLRSLIAADDIERARDTAKRESRLLFGEVKGLPPHGFDHGNSPVEAASLDLAGRDAVLFTTNGTRALCMLAPLGTVFTGALANVTAVAERVSRFDRVALVCAGESRGRRFAIEDFAAAGAIIQRLARLSPGIEPGDAAGLAMTATGYEDWLAPALPQQTARSTRLIAGSEHGRALIGMGLGPDVNFAAREDWSTATPKVVEHGVGWARLVNESTSGQ